jgi:fermentation-respiration switch protein FrsA (DUF1100 family)
VDTTKFIEIDIALPPSPLLNSNIELNGKLTLPNTIGKVTCVILVQGSGPSDYDETISVNKPFRDIAYGLSSNGIAVLRYDKRTYDKRILTDTSIDLKNITVNEESVFDAVNAANFAFSNYADKIDNVYILGHSLGGYVMPRIAKLANNATGFILLAGNARPMEALIKEQLQYMYENFGNTNSWETRQKLNTELERCDKITSRNYTADTPSDSLPLNVPAKYWLDLVDYHPADEFADETRPILFIQGGRDYQVTKTDLEIWRDKLTHNKQGGDNATFVLFEDLNHLMQSGSGIPSPADYGEKKNVDVRVINEIIKFIRK